MSLHHPMWKRMAAHSEQANHRVALLPYSSCSTHKAEQLQLGFQSSGLVEFLISPGVATWHFRSSGEPFMNSEQLGSDSNSPYSYGKTTPCGKDGDKWWI